MRAIADQRNAAIDIRTPVMALLHKMPPFQDNTGSLSPKRSANIGFTAIRCSRDRFCVSDISRADDLDNVTARLQLNQNGVARVSPPAESPIYMHTHR